MEPKTDFDFYIKFVKPLVLGLPKSDDRVLAAAWVKKLISDTEATEKIKLDYVKLLLFVLQRKRLAPPFTEHPNGTGPLTEFPQNQTLVEVARKLIEQENKERANKRRRESGDFPPYISDFSADLLEYVAVQTIENFGVHGYYAISKQPLSLWHRVDKNLFPKAAKSMIEVGGGPPTVVTTSSTPTMSERTPRAPPFSDTAGGEISEIVPPPTPKRKATPKRSALGASPPSAPIGRVLPPDDDRTPITWGSNLLEVKKLLDEARRPSPSSGEATEVLWTHGSGLLDESPPDILLDEVPSIQVPPKNPQQLPFTDAEYKPVTKVNVGMRLPPKPASPPRKFANKPLPFQDTVYQPIKKPAAEEVKPKKTSSQSRLPMRTKHGRALSHLVKKKLPLTPKSHTDPAPLDLAVNMDPETVEMLREVEETASPTGRRGSPITNPMPRHISLEDFEQMEKQIEDEMRDQGLDPHARQSNLPQPRQMSNVADRAQAQYESLKSTPGKGKDPQVSAAYDKIAKAVVAAPKRRRPPSPPSPPSPDEAPKVFTVEAQVYTPPAAASEVRRPPPPCSPASPDEGPQVLTVEAQVYTPPSQPVRPDETRRRPAPSSPQSPDETPRVFTVEPQMHDEPRPRQATPPRRPTPYPHPSPHSPISLPEDVTSSEPIHGYPAYKQLYDAERKGKIGGRDRHREAGKTKLKDLNWVPGEQYPMDNNVQNMRDRARERAKRVARSKAVETQPMSFGNVGYDPVSSRARHDLPGIGELDEEQYAADRQKAKEYLGQKYPDLPETLSPTQAQQDAIAMINKLYDRLSPAHGVQQRVHPYSSRHPEIRQAGQQLDNLIEKEAPWRDASSYLAGDSSSQFTPARDPREKQPQFYFPNMEIAGEGETLEGIEPPTEVTNVTPNPMEEHMKKLGQISQMYKELMDTSPAFAGVPILTPSPTVRPIRRPIQVDLSGIGPVDSSKFPNYLEYSQLEESPDPYELPHLPPATYVYEGRGQQTTPTDPDLAEFEALEAQLAGDTPPRPQYNPQAGIMPTAIAQAVALAQYERLKSPQPCSPHEDRHSPPPRSPQAYSPQFKLSEVSPVQRDPTQDQIAIDQSMVSPPRPEWKENLQYFMSGIKGPNIFDVYAPDVTGETPPQLASPVSPPISPLNVGEVRAAIGAAPAFSPPNRRRIRKSPTVPPIREAVEVRSPSPHGAFYQPIDGAMGGESPPGEIFQVEKLTPDTSPKWLMDDIMNDARSLGAVPHSTWLQGSRTYPSPPHPKAPRPKKAPDVWAIPESPDRGYLRGQRLEYPESPTSSRALGPSPTAAQGPRRRSVRKRLTKRKLDFSPPPPSQDEHQEEYIDEVDIILDDGIDEDREQYFSLKSPQAFEDTLEDFADSRRMQYRPSSSSQRTPEDRPKQPHTERYTPTTPMSRPKQMERMVRRVRRHQPAFPSPSEYRVHYRPMFEEDNPNALAPLEEQSFNEEAETIHNRTEAEVEALLAEQERREEEAMNNMRTIMDKSISPQHQLPSPMEPHYRRPLVHEEQIYRTPPELRRPPCPAPCAALTPRQIWPARYRDVLQHEARPNDLVSPERSPSPRGYLDSEESPPAEWASPVSPIKNYGDIERMGEAQYRQLSPGGRARPPPPSASRRQGDWQPCQDEEDEEFAELERLAEQNPEIDLEEAAAAMRIRPSRRSPQQEIAAAQYALLMERPHSPASPQRDQDLDEFEQLEREFEAETGGAEAPPARPHPPPGRHSDLGRVAERAGAQYDSLPKPKTARSRSPESRQMRKMYRKLKKTPAAMERRPIYVGGAELPRRYRRLPPPFSPVMEGEEEEDDDDDMNEGPCMAERSARRIPSNRDEAPNWYEMPGIGSNVTSPEIASYRPPCALPPNAIDLGGSPPVPSYQRAFPLETGVRESEYVGHIVPEDVGDMKLFDEHQPDLEHPAYGLPNVFVVEPADDWAHITPPEGVRTPSPEPLRYVPVPYDTPSPRGLRQNLEQHERVDPNEVDWMGKRVKADGPRERAALQQRRGQLSPVYETKAKRRPPLPAAPAASTSNQSAKTLDEIMAAVDQQYAQLTGERAPSPKSPTADEFEWRMKSAEFDPELYAKKRRPKSLYGKKPKRRYKAKLSTQFEAPESFYVSPQGAASPCSIQQDYDNEYNDGNSNVEGSRQYSPTDLRTPINPRDLEYSPAQISGEYLDYGQPDLVQSPEQTPPYARRPPEVAPRSVYAARSPLILEAELPAATDYQTELRDRKMPSPRLASPAAAATTTRQPQVLVASPMERAATPGPSTSRVRTPSPQRTCPRGTCTTQLDESEATFNESGEIPPPFGGRTSPGPYSPLRTNELPEHQRGFKWMDQ